MIVGNALSAPITCLAYFNKKDVYQRFPSGILERRKFKLRSDGDGDRRLRCVYIHRHRCTLSSRKGMPCVFYIYHRRRCFYLLSSLSAMVIPTTSVCKGMKAIDSLRLFFYHRKHSSFLYAILRESMETVKTYGCATAQYR